jgi:hypothetical protein
MMNSESLLYPLADALQVGLTYQAKKKTIVGKGNGHVHVGKTEIPVRMQAKAGFVSHDQGQALVLMHIGFGPVLLVGYNHSKRSISTFLVNPDKVKDGLDGLIVDVNRARTIKGVVDGIGEAIQEGSYLLVDRLKWEKIKW